MRKVLACILIVSALLWLILSYLPVQMISLNFLTQGVLAQEIFRMALLASVVLFLAVQLILVGSSLRMSKLVQKYHTHPEIQLNFALEVFWTTLPLVVTVALLFVGRQAI